MLESDPVSEKWVAIVQSCYIPWKGYFDLVAQVDEFILFDDAQFTRRDWRNRNIVKTQGGPKWLTIPVESKGKFEARIDEVKVSQPDWTRRHWETLRHAYAKAACFKQQKDWVAELYQGMNTDMLSLVNYRFIKAISDFLQLETKLSWSTDYGESDSSKTERLLELLRASKATHYLSGPSAKTYLDHSAFAAEGVTVTYADYAGYKEYDQPHPPFRHEVSILDLIFCLGDDARSYMKS